MTETLRGAEDFARLGSRLKDLGEFSNDGGKLRREVSKGLREVARPVGMAMRTSLGEAMPKRGGLSERVKKSRISQSNAMGGRSPKVVISLRVAEGYDLAAMEDGRLRHPTYGHKPWVLQSVPDGKAHESLEKMLPIVQANLKRHIETVLDEIGG